MNLSLKTLVLISALLQTPAPATGVRINGRVIDGETGKPLADATVTLSTAHEVKQTVTVNTNGTFQFTNISRGAYVLRANHTKPVVPYRSESLDIVVADRNIEELGMILSPAIPKVPVTARFAPAIPSFKLSGEQVTVQRDGTFEVRMRPLEKYELDLPDGYFVESVSAGQWEPVTGRWMLRDKPASTVQITLGAGRLKFSGRLLLANRGPSTSGTILLTGPAPSTASRTITPGAGGVFSAEGLRSGAYQVRAQAGSGATLQANWFDLTLSDQTREGMEILLKEMTLIKGQVVVTGRPLEDLMRFKPVVGVEDAQSSSRTVPIDPGGTFEFRSFDGSFKVGMSGLPIEFRVQSVTLGPSSVTIRVTSRPGDAPPSLEFPRIR